MKEHQGELWGITNLFKETADKVNAHEIFEQERQDLQYRIQQCDTLGQQLLCFGKDPCSRAWLHTRHTQSAGQ